MAVDLSQFGMTPPGAGMPDAMPPAPGRPPGGMGGGMEDMALQALDGMMPKSPSPTVAMQKVEQAFDLAHKLVMTALPQLSQWNPKVAGQAHAAGRLLLTIKGDIRKEAMPMPPPDLSMGFGMAGAPGGLVGSPPPSRGAGGGTY